MASLLQAAGEKFEEKKDGIIIHGKGNHHPMAAEFQSEHDHRIAMAGGVLALMGAGTSRIIDAEATNISYPEFWSDLRRLVK
jgi:3-phosphoshikimate 1-carboxyvinyltransferase